MIIERAVLGPAQGDRAYGLLATSPGLHLTQRQSATLSAFILGARASTTTKEGRYAAFFPLDGREGEAWALALAETLRFGESFIVFADALILPRSFLDGRGWPAHRVALAQPRRPEVAAGHAPAYDLDERAFHAEITEEAAPSAGDCDDFVDDFYETDASFHIELRAPHSPMAVCARLWEELDEARRGRTFCTETDYAWPDRSTEPFDLTIGGRQAPRGALVVPFDKNGVLADPTRPHMAWNKSLRAFRGPFYALIESSRPGGRRPVAPDAVQAFRIELREALRASARPPAEVLAAAAEVGARLRGRSLDEPHIKALGFAILDEFEACLRRFDARAAAGALETYCARIAPSLKGVVGEAYPVRWALETEALLLLSPSAIDAIAPGLHSADAFLLNARALIERTRGASAQAIAALSRHAAAALRDRDGEQLSLFAVELLGRAGLAAPVDADPRSVGALAEALLHRDRFGGAADGILAWASGVRAGAASREWVGECIRTIARLRAGRPYRRAGELLIDLAIHEVADCA